MINQNIKPQVIELLKAYKKISVVSWAKLSPADCDRLGESALAIRSVVLQLAGKGDGDSLDDVQKLLGITDKELEI